MTDPWGQSAFGAFNIPGPPSWTESANCATTDPDIFHPPEKGSHSIRDARKVCGNCDVVSECLEWALETNDRYGILGGLTPGQRSRLKRERRKADGNRVRCRICESLFVGKPQNLYCSTDCHLEARRVRDRRRSA